MSIMIKKLANTALFLLMLVLLSSSTVFFCKRGGIRGNIYRVQGNQMPSPDVPPPTPQPLQTTLYIYELTNISQVKKSAQASFYTSINSKAVKEVQSDKKGFFKVKLPPGQYSLFIKKDSLFYANLFDDKNNIAPITVKKGQYTTVDVKADYDAVY